MHTTDVSFIKNYYNSDAERDWKLNLSLLWQNELQEFAGYGATRVLDAGCGIGMEAGELRRRGISCVGIDFADKVIATAKKRLPGLEFYEMDMTALKFSDESFDGLWSSMALSSIPSEKTQAVLDGFYRVLQPGGLAFIATDSDKLQPEGSTLYGTTWSHSSLTAMVVKAGFKIIRSETAPKAIRANGPDGRWTLYPAFMLNFFLHKPHPLTQV